MESLDVYDIRPKAMDAYLRHNGWCFSKELCEWAVSKMRDRNGNKVQMTDKERVEKLCTDNGVTLEDVQGWDAVYLHAMAMADYYGTTLTTEAQVAHFISDTLTDPDAPDGCVFAVWYAKMCRAGVRVPWEDVV